MPCRAGRARTRDSAFPEAPTPRGARTGGRPLRELAFRACQARGPPTGTLPLGPERLARASARPAFRLDGGQASGIALMGVGPGDSGVRRAPIGSVSD